MQGPQGGAEPVPARSWRRESGRGRSPVCRGTVGSEACSWGRFGLYPEASEALGGRREPRQPRKPEPTGGGYRNRRALGSFLVGEAWAGHGRKEVSEDQRCL